MTLGVSALFGLHFVQETSFLEYLFFYLLQDCGFILSRKYEKIKSKSRIYENIVYLHSFKVVLLVNLDNLFLRIKELGLNSKKVSECTGISTGNISDWKSGRSFPTAQKLVILADCLDCSIDYLLGRTDTPEVNGGKSLDEPDPNI